MNYIPLIITYLTLFILSGLFKLNEIRRYRKNTQPVKKHSQSTIKVETNEYWSFLNNEDKIWIVNQYKMTR